MKVGDRVERLSTKAHFKVIETNNQTGKIKLQRLISGSKSDNIIEISETDIRSYKVIRPIKDTIPYFDDEFDFLSNFYISDVEYEGITYPSNEHAFQAAKTLNKEERLTIRDEASPSRAKFKGRHVKLRDNWEEIKLDIMYNICLNKFKNNPELKEKLLNTGNKVLIEGNTWNDDYWGKCTDEGKNNLGIILMKIREELK